MEPYKKPVKTIRNALIGFYTLLFLLLVFSGFNFYRQSGKVLKNQTETTIRSMRKLDIMSSLQKNAMHIQVAVLRHIAATDTAFQQSQERIISQAFIANSNYVLQIQKMLEDSAERRLLDDFMVTRLSNSAARDSVLALSRAHNPAAVIYFHSVQDKTFEEWEEAVSAFAAHIQVQTQTHLNNIQQQRTIMVRRVFALYSVIVLLLILLGFIILKAVKHLKQQQQIVLKSEEKYRNIFEGSYDAIGIFDEKGYLDCNQRALELFRISSVEEFRKFKPTDLSPETQPDGINTAEAAKGYMQAVWNKGFVRFEWYCRKTTGEVFPVEMMLTTVEIGEKTVIQTTIRDISERKKFESALQQEKEWLRVMLQGMGDAVIATDINGKIILMNTIAEHLTGWKAEVACSQPLSEIFHIVNQHTRKRCDNPVDLVIKSGEIVGLANSTVLIAKNGFEYIIADSAAPLRDHSGKIFGIILVFRDDTKKYQAQEAIRESEERFRNFIQSSSDLIQSVSEKGQILFVNDAWKKTLGFTSEDIPHLRITDIIAEESQEKCEAELREILKGGRINNMEAVFLTKDKRKIWVEGEASPRIINGKIIGTQAFFRDVTEKRRAQMEIDKARKLSETAVNSLPGIFYLIEKSGKFRMWNRNFETVSGYSANEILKMHPLDFFDVDEKELVASRIHEVFTTGKSEVEAPFYTKDKRKIPHYFTGYHTIIEGEDYLIGVGLDITQRLQYEQEITASAIKLRSTLDNMMEGVQLIGFDWKYIYLNQAAEIQNRKTVEEMMGRTMFELFPHLETTEVFGHLSKAMTQRLPAETETKFVFTDGVVRWFHLSVQPVPEGIFILSVDITERKEAENAIQKSESLLREVSLSIPGVVYQFKMTPDGTMSFPFVSEGTKVIFGLTPQEVYADVHNAFAAVHPDDLPAIMATILVSAGNLSPWSQLFRIVINGKPIRWIKGDAIPKRLEDGSILWNGTFFDYTVMKEAHDNLLSANNELDQFVYSTSHDLRAPLASIRGIIDITEIENLDEETIQHLQMIRKSVLRLEESVNGILQYSRNKRTEVEHLPVSFVHLIEEVKDSVRFIPESTDIELKLDIDESIAFYGDRRRLLFIFENMFSNAIKYHDAAKPHKWFKVKVRTAQNEACFEFEDNGSGIEPAYQSRIFEMFFRASQAATGTGLGLYIVKETITRLGGSIQFESQPGIGTRFIVCVPNYNQEN